MKSFIVILAIVGLVGAWGTIIERSEYRDKVEDIQGRDPPGKWGGTADEWRAYWTERWRDGLFINKMGVVGTIFLWLLTSGLTWLLWKLTVTVFRFALGIPPPSNDAP